MQALAGSLNKCGCSVKMRFRVFPQELPPIEASTDTNTRTSMTVTPTLPTTSTNKALLNEKDRLGLLNRATSMASRGMPVSVNVEKLEESLEAHNPIAALPMKDFLELLSLMVDCEQIAHGKPRTKTSITLSEGLAYLTGEKPFESVKSIMNSPFSLGQLEGIGLSPIAAFVYRRLVTEVAALQGKK